MIGTYQRLGDETSDVIIRNLIETSRVLFPSQTEQAELWLNERIKEYGISYARYQAERALMDVTPWLQSPIVWFAGAWLFFSYVKK